MHMTIQYSRSFLKYIITSLHGVTYLWELCFSQMPQAIKLRAHYRVQVISFQLVNQWVSQTKFMQDIEIVLGYFSGVDNTDLSHRKWRNQAGSDLEASFLLTRFSQCLAVYNTAGKKSNECSYSDIILQDTVSTSLAGNVIAAIAM